MRYILGFALAALPALAQSAAVAPLAIYTEFRQQPTPAMIDSIHRELARILAPLGFPFEWWPIEGRPPDQQAVDLAVVTFRGQCSAANLLSTAGTSGPLAFTFITDGEVLPFAEVNCDRIHDFLREGLIRIWEKDREVAFGRAVGRVVAHELYHIFVRTKEHGSKGVAEPAFTETELLAGHFDLENHEFRRLRASLKQARTQNSRFRSAASAVAGKFIFAEGGCAACHGAQGNGTGFGPPLRGKIADVRAFAGRLASDLQKMCRTSKAARLKPQPLDDDEIADVVSFLNGSE